MKEKIYKCCICHRRIKKEHTIRLVEQKYGAGKYTQFYQTTRYDFCKDCYSKFNKWILKHKKKENE